MVIQIARRQIDNLLRRGSYTGAAALIGEGDEGIGVGDVDPAVREGHAEGRIQSLQKCPAHVGGAISVSVAQERDPIGAFGCRAGTLHCGAHDQFAEAEPTPLLFRRITFSNQHIAIGQDVQPTGVVETCGEGIDP
ncbi:hypothetical protein D9M68_822200 [compost metagenome]